MTDRPTITRAFLSALAASAFFGCAPEKPGAARPVAIELFDGETLAGWRTLEFEVGGGAPASVPGDGTLRLAAGEPLAGIVLDNPEILLPKGAYEISLEAMIIDGDDFFCGLTFPVPSQGTCCTLIVGGWGGTLVGISSVNGMDASSNTTRYDRPFEPRRWYAISVRVTDQYLDAWIDGEPVIQLEIRDRKLGMRSGAIEQCQPIGLATYRTAAAYRKLRLRELF